MATIQDYLWKAQGSVIPLLVRLTLTLEESSMVELLSCHNTQYSKKYNVSALGDKYDFACTTLWSLP